jgi:hypothetical protein
MRRTLTYAAGWAVLTFLAAVVVWWGLGPLLAPIMQSVAPPPQSPSPSHVSPNPVISPSPVAPSPARPLPRPSMFEGWQYVHGAFTQTFTLAGGSATVRITGGRAELVSSQAANGYRITPRQPSAGRLVVEFFDGTHFFVLDVMWWEDKPYAKITQVS